MRNFLSAVWSRIRIEFWRLWAIVKNIVRVLFFTTILALIGWAFAVWWNFLIGTAFHGPEIPLWAGFIVVTLVMISRLRRLQ